jgi:hypothetical protein
VVLIPCISSLADAAGLLNAAGLKRFRTSGAALKHLSGVLFDPATSKPGDAEQVAWQIVLGGTCRLFPS